MGFLPTQMAANLRVHAALDCLTVVLPVCLLQSAHPRQRGIPLQRGSRDRLDTFHWGGSFGLETLFLLLFVDVHEKVMVLVGNGFRAVFDYGVAYVGHF